MLISFYTIIKFKLHVTLENPRRKERENSVNSDYFVLPATPEGSKHTSLVPKRSGSPTKAKDHLDRYLYL
jgi:hypothetical protein